MPVEDPSHSPPAVRLIGVSKDFGDPTDVAGSLKDAFLGLFSSSRVRRSPASSPAAPRSPSDPPNAVRALRGIDLEIARGESVGIVGANGSGKSTLLKLVAGISEPSAGTVETRGRLVAMIELGAGFHPDLTGEENVRLQAAIHGFPAARAAARMDAILDFAELSDFRSTPLRHYSSGMTARLGFSVAIHSEPEILLVDEVLSVGDRRFQERCLEAIESLRRGGTTVILVTHDMSLAERVCERLVWLRDGAIRRAGPALEVLREFQRDLLERDYGVSEGALSAERVLVDAPGRFGDGRARIEEVRLADAAGRPRHNFVAGEPFAIEIDWRADARLAAEAEGLDCSVAITFEDGENAGFWRAEAAGELHPFAGASSRTPPLAPEGEAVAKGTDAELPAGPTGRFRLHFDAPPFLPGAYVVSCAISPPGGGEAHHDLHLRLHRFHVLPARDDEESGVAIALHPTARFEGARDPFVGDENRCMT